MDKHINNESEPNYAEFSPILRARTRTKQKWKYDMED